MSLITTSEAITRLRQGDVIALPTETVYGLAGRIDSEPALKKIFSTKQRPSFDPLIVHVAEVQHARDLCAEWPALYDALTSQFWPGPLTLIAKKRDVVSNTITSGLDTVAFRQPKHPVFLDVLRGVGIPLAAPSANRFGRTSPTTAAHVEHEFSGSVAIVDGGPCTVGVESTVLTARTVAGRWQLQILRPGGVSRAELSAFLLGQGFQFELTRESSVASPGHLKEHYQPASPLILLEDQSWSPAVQVAVEKKLGRPIHSTSEVRLPATPQEAARVLYAEFRRLARDGEHVLWIRRLPSQSGLDWEAIWDRVERASSLTL